MGLANRWDFSACVWVHFMPSSYTCALFLFFFFLPLVLWLIIWKIEISENLKYQHYVLGSTCYFQWREPCKLEWLGGGDSTGSWCLQRAVHPLFWAALKDAICNKSQSFCWLMTYILVLFSIFLSFEGSSSWNSIVLPHGSFSWAWCLKWQHC